METMNTVLSSFALKDLKRFKLKVGVFLFLIQDDQILLLRRFNTGIDDGQYGVPMGALEGNETVTSALMREAAEEANISVKPEDLTVCHVMHRFHTTLERFSFEQIDIFFKVSVYEGIIKNLEPHKCDELKFYPINDLPPNTIPFIRAAINSTLEGQCFSEFGWEN